MQRLKLFGNILHQLAQGHGQFVLKFWVKIQRGSSESCKLNTRGMENWHFSTNISFYSKTVKIYGHNYNRRRILVCDLLMVSFTMTLS